MAENQPIEIKLENGMVIKGADMQEALKNAAEMVQENSKYAREMKSKFEEMQGQFTNLQQQVTASQQVVHKDANGFDKDHYYQLLNSDPVEAQNYVDAHRFGIKDPKEVPVFFTNMHQKIEKFDGLSMAANFQNAHPEFPPDAESAKELTGRVRQLVNMGYPTEQGTMDLAWSQLVSEGKLKPLEQQQQDEEIPPSLQGGSGGQISESELKKAEQMSDKELAAYLKSKGML